MKLFRRDESGQVLAIFALALVALLGFAALAIDVSLMLHKRAELQKAADAAALAGIMDVWEKSSTHAVGEARAIDYAETNGADQVEATVLHKYEPYVAHASLVGKPIFLEVKVESTVNHFFGPIIGIKSSAIKADAVAVKVAAWEGETLPFVNLHKNPAVGSELVIWDKGTPGDRERILDDELTYSDDPYPHFRVNLEDGVAVKKGRDNNIDPQLQTMWEYYGNSKPIYLLSLSPDRFDKESFTVNKVETVDMNDFKNLKNKDSIILDHLVLLECIWTSYEKETGNNAVLRLTVNKVLNFDEVPDSYDSVGKIISYLVK